MSTYTYVFNMLLIHVWCMMLYLNYIYITPALQVSLKHGVRTTEHVNVRPIWTIPVWRRNFSNSSTRPWRLGGSISVFKARQLIDYCRWLYYIILYYTILYYIILINTVYWCILEIIIRGKSLLTRVNKVTTEGFWTLLTWCRFNVGFTQCHRFNPQVWGLCRCV